MVSENDFSRLYEEGLRYDEDCFVFYMLESEEPRPRIGIVTPKYLGSAITRNRIKRIIRENFRKNKELFAGFDFIVRPKKCSSSLTNPELGEKFLTNFQASREFYKGDQGSK